MSRSASATWRCVVASAIERPRPFSLAAGLATVTVGVGSIVDAVTPVETGGVAALALLLGGTGALIALTTRRAPSPPDEQE